MAIITPDQQETPLGRLAIYALAFVFQALLWGATIWAGIPKRRGRR